MTNCNHQFHTIEQATRPATSGNQSTAIAQRWNEINGVRVGCSKCGEIRVIWANGDLVIETPGHEYIDSPQG